MDHFSYRDGALFCDEVPAAELAERYETPLYVYCAATIRHHFDVLRRAYAGAESPPLICYSVKANSNLGVLKLLHDQGAGFDVVSGGELARVLEIGADPKKVVYAGVGKTEREIRQAIEAEILLFNVESESELRRISVCATELGRRVGVAIRVNPDVDPKTHRYITTGKRENKFGVDLAGARRTFAVARDLSGVSVQGVHVHLGSQITETDPYVVGIGRILDFVRDQREHLPELQYLDMGGGFGVHYRGEEAKPADQFAQAILPLVEGSGLRLILEPGRFIMANAGVLLTRVITIKRSGGRRFAICDAGMNDLLRPSLYQAYHRIWPAQGGAPDDAATEPLQLTDVVGPICESGDFLALDRELPEFGEGDLLAVSTAGAYGFAMASNYNTRPRPAEVLVDGSQPRLVRRRESLDDLLGPERDPE